MLRPYPKPSRNERKESQKQSKGELRKERGRNAELAVIRDGGLCVFCYFLKGIKRRHDDVHHVYGRDNEEGGWREHYTNLVCTCRECHPPRIMFKGGSARLAYVEEVLKKANSTPINEDFKHSYGYEKGQGPQD